MYKGGKIIISLIIFAALFSIPFFYNIGKINAGPDVALPAMQQLEDYECVESPEYMKENHMQLLNQWREEAVRNGQTVYINSQGKEFKISLQETCLKCHADELSDNPNVLSNPANKTGVSNPAINDSPEFCASCHDYSAVKPLCWSCHFEPEEAVK